MLGDFRFVKAITHPSDDPEAACVAVLLETRSTSHDPRESDFLEATGLKRWRLEDESRYSHDPKTYCTADSSFSGTGTAMDELPAGFAMATQQWLVLEPYNVSRLLWLGVSDDLSTRHAIRLR